MQALVVYCHPNPQSYTAGIRDAVVAKLMAAGAGVEVIDLYGEGFQPVLTQEDLACYEEVGENCREIASHAAAIGRADTLIFVYPTWWYGLPAMLKGWLDRVFVPGVAFHMPCQEHHNIRAGLGHITRLGVFTTCGASWWLTRLIGAPGRRTLMRGIGFLCSRRMKTVFAAHYLMDSSTPTSRARHIRRVEAAMDRLIGAAPVRAGQMAKAA